MSLTTPHKYKSMGVRSGDLGGVSVDQRLPITFTRHVFQELLYTDGVVRRNTILLEVNLVEIVAVYYSHGAM
jgi:hypothetical protein